jgi:hypothetical protein
LSRWSPSPKPPLHFLNDSERRRANQRIVGAGDGAENKVFLVSVRVSLARLRPHMINSAFVVFSKKRAGLRFGSIPLFLLIPFQKRGDKLLLRPSEMVSDPFNILIGEDGAESAAAVGTPGTIDNLEYVLVQLQSDPVNLFAGSHFQAAEKLVILGIVVLGVCLPVAHNGVVGIARHYGGSVFAMVLWWLAVLDPYSLTANDKGISDCRSGGWHAMTLRVKACHHGRTGQVAPRPLGSYK